MATVLKIPAKFHPITHLPETKVQKRRVAAYARVSTDSEEQQTSYAAQVDRYTKYIQERADWEFVAVYTDEGISALNTKHRDGFNRMVADALDGKIDLIVTKSVSRFARNTVDSLTTVRKLKEKGVEVFFEKENIYTLDSKGELLITIMSSLAQEESRSISENVTWGQRKRMADGKVSLPYKHFLGYRKGADGLPEIVPEEAEIVRNIYRWFMEGKTPTGIARTLTEQGVPTPAGKEQWCSSTVKSILTNEKYKGSALLQKRFTVDFLTKKSKVNEGEVPQYYIEESHPAIIVPEEFELVQESMSKEDLEAIAEVLRGTNIMVLSDEIYAELRYDSEKHIPFSNFEGMKERTVVVSGFSKTFAMTGWRLGYALGPERIIKLMTKIHQYGIMSAPTTAQFAAIEALKSCDDDIEEMRREYNYRRRYIVDGFRAMGLSCFEPLGAFYVFPCIKSTGMTSEEFCQNLLMEEKVAVVPGNAFGESGEGFIRCSYAYSIENIQEALKRIEKFVKRHSK